MTAIEKLNSIITSVDTLAQIADDCNFPAVRAIYADVLNFSHARTISRHLQMQYIRHCTLLHHTTISVMMFTKQPRCGFATKNTRSQ